MAKIRPNVWCDITCSQCGAMANGSGYFYNGIIKELRNNTKDWVDNDGTVLCPYCQLENQGIDPTLIF